MVASKDGAEAGSNEAVSNGAEGAKDAGNEVG